MGPGYSAQVQLQVTHILVTSTIRFEVSLQTAQTGLLLYY
jgi:hypothetical protein